MKIGLQELLIVFIVALIVLGPDKLPEYARKFGEALKQFRKYSSEATKDIRENIVEPLEEAQRPLKEAMEPITDLEKTVRKDVSDLKKDLTGMGKSKAKSPADTKAESEPVDAAADHIAAGSEAGSGISEPDIPDLAANGISDPDEVSTISKTPETDPDIGSSDMPETVSDVSEVSETD